MKKTVAPLTLLGSATVVLLAACSGAVDSPVAPSAPTTRFDVTAAAVTCTPTITTTEGDLAPGGLGSFTVTSAAGVVTVDPINSGTGLLSLTVLPGAVNATVPIPAFTLGTYNPTPVTFQQNNPNQAVDFTLRAANAYHAIFVRVQCACTPILTVTEGDLAPGGPISFTFTAGPGSVTTDPVDVGFGLRSLSTTTTTNAVVTHPAFASGTFSPVTSTFTIPNAALPSSFTFRAASLYHAANVRATCVGNPAP